MDLIKHSAQKTDLACGQRYTETDYLCHKANKYGEGGQNTKLTAKERNEYGNTILGNVGVFRRSAVSALLFIIYLDDVMEDYKALNDNKNIPKNMRRKDADVNNARIQLNK